MEAGILAGFPILDVKVTLCDGSYHETDSNESAFRFAGATAFTEAAKKASPVVLEPMMAIEIEVPKQLATAIQSEICTHRGRVEDKLTTDGFSEIRAIVPLSELLIASSEGIADFPREFVGYEPVSDRGSSDENDAGVTANKRNNPRPSRRSETARPNSEDMTD